VLFVKDQLTKRAEFVTPELVPLKNYVEQCISNVADEAIFLAEAQGGYVKIPDQIAQDPTAYLDEPIKLPYWRKVRLLKWERIASYWKKMVRMPVCINYNLPIRMCNFKGMSVALWVKRIKLLRLC
jgi:hypothetical protein